IHELGLPAAAIPDEEVEKPVPVAGNEVRRSAEERDHLAVRGYRKRVGNSRAVVRRFAVEADTDELRRARQPISDANVRNGVGCPSRSRTKTARRPSLPGPGTRFVASLSKAANRPSADNRMFVDAPSAWPGGPWAPKVRFRVRRGASAAS